MPTKRTASPKILAAKLKANRVVFQLEKQLTQDWVVLEVLDYPP